MEGIMKSIFNTNELNNWQLLMTKYLPLIISVLIAFFVINQFMKFVKKIIKKSKIPKNAHAFVASAIKILLYFIVVMSVCSHLGIDITTVVATFSIVGVAISLSVQNTLSNVMAGLSLLFTKQFSVDDFIEIDGITGTITRIGLFNCKLRTFDGYDIYVPNSSVIAQKVKNYSTEPARMVNITIGTSYSESVDRVKNALGIVVEETSEILKDQPVFIGITSFGESAINYSVRVWVNNSDYWSVYFAMHEKIKRVFEKENIEIPFNQLDVHIKND